MNFLLNMNIPPSFGHRLVEVGHACRHVAEIGMSQASDNEIVKQARANQEIIITHDLDYGQLLAFSGKANPSVIIFRFRDTSSENMFARLMDKWPEIEQPLAHGAIVVMEDASLRIRRLPLS